MCLSKLFHFFIPELLRHESDPPGRIRPTLLVRQLSCFHGAKPGASVLRLRW